MPGPMRPAPLWQVSLITDSGHESFAAECLREVTGESTSSYFDWVRGQVQVSVYCAKRPGGTLLSRLGGCLQSRVMDASVPRVEVRYLRGRDWANSWKRHFKPLAIGRSLLIRPGWSPRRAVPGQRVIVLDPGLSFGTGQHATTRYCLEQVVALRPRATRKALLDLGTGSGILAIAARKLGYDPVDAVDHDPVAIRSASANARRNRVAVRMIQADVVRLVCPRSGGYDVVCANLTADLLVECARGLGAFVARGGHLVLAGVLGTEYKQVRRAWVTEGWRMVRTGVSGEWQSGTFVAI